MSYEDTLRKEHEATLKSGFDKLPQNGTGLILLSGIDDRPIFGRATSNARGYGAGCYKVLKLVRDANGDTGVLWDEKHGRKKAHGGFADEIIAEIEKNNGVIRVHSFIPTDTIDTADKLKREMYRLGVFSAVPQMYLSRS